VNAAVLSGNRNFEARVNPDVRANYLASPPLVVAYALAGSMQVDLNGHRSAPTRPARRCISGTSGRATARSPRSCAEHHQADVHEEIRRCVQRRRALAQDQRQGCSHLRLGLQVDLRPETRPILSAWDARRRQSRISSMPACSACFSIRSPPTTSRQRAPSSSIRRPASISWTTRSSRSISISTAPAAAIMR